VGLKLLLAGCSKEERADAEAEVRLALGKRIEADTWTVSLVSIGGRWSVTLDAPALGIRALTLMAAASRLRETIVEALAPPGASASVTSTVEAGAHERRAPSRCEKCGQPFVVIYEAVTGEGEETVPVACPHCWAINHALIGGSAAESRDYRAEKPS
jgi:hypothetical protein